MIHAGHEWTEEQLTWCRKHGITFSILPDWGCTEGFDGPRRSVFVQKDGSYASAPRVRGETREGMTIREAIIWCVER